MVGYLLLHYRMDINIEEAGLDLSRKKHQAQNPALVKGRDNWNKKQ